PSSLGGERGPVHQRRAHHRLGAAQAPRGPPDHRHRGRRRLPHPRRTVSVRLKLALSYAGFLVLAGAVLLAAGWLFLSRVPHVGLIYVPGYRDAILREFAPTAAITLLFLLVFGLV